MAYFMILIRERRTINISLIIIQTSIIRINVCRNDPIFKNVEKIVQWIKGTLGITG